MIRKPNSFSAHSLTWHVFWKVFEQGQDRIGGRLTQTTDGRIHHRLGQLLQQRHIPGILLHQFHGLFRANATGRTLATAFILKELHQVQGDICNIVLIGQDNHGGGPDETAIRLQRIKIQRDIAQAGWQDTTGRAAGQVSLERVT